MTRSWICDFWEGLKEGAELELGLVEEWVDLAGERGQGGHWRLRVVEVLIQMLWEPILGTRVKERSGLLPEVGDEGDADGNDDVIDDSCLSIT